MANESKNRASTENLEDALMDEMDADARLGSGSHDPSGDADLDFINMSGLVARPKKALQTPVKKGKPASYEDTDLDPEAPVSFYEEGVDDVDTSMDPANASPLDDEEILGNKSNDASASPALAGLQDIISELNSDEESDDDKPSNEIDSLEDEQEPELAVDYDVDDLANINLQAASAALDDLNIPEDTEELDSADVSSLIASIDFGEAEALLRELEDQLVEEVDDEVDVEPYSEVEPEPYIEAEESSAIERYMDEKPAVVEQVKPQPAAPTLVAPETANRVSFPEIDLNNLSHGRPEELDASVYTKPPLPKSITRHKRRRTFGANLLRFSFVVGLLAVIAGFAYYSWKQLETENLTPQQAYATGVTLIDEGQFAEASNHFTRFTRRYPEHLLAIDAEFMAAYALQLTPPDPPNTAQEAYRTALLKFESFVQTNPSHEKTARAETLIGILHYKVGDYPTAIHLLSDPKRRLRDTSGYLPALRTLARAYVEQGDMSNARMTYMRVAAMDENISPVKDYIELASVYNRLSAQETDPQRRQEYMTQSIEFWDKSIRMPGLLSAKRKELELLRNYTEDELGRLSTNPANPVGERVDQPTVSVDAVSEPPSELDIDALRLPETTP